MKRPRFTFFFETGIWPPKSSIFITAPLRLTVRCRSSWGQHTSIHIQHFLTSVPGCIAKNYRVRRFASKRLQKCDYQRSGDRLLRCGQRYAPDVQGDARRYSATFQLSCYRRYEGLVTGREKLSDTEYTPSRSPERRLEDGASGEVEKFP